MSLASQLMSEKDRIQESLFIGKARWEKLLAKVDQAENAHDVDYKDEQVLTFITCAAYAIAGSKGVACSDPQKLDTKTTNFRG